MFNILVCAQPLSVGEPSVKLLMLELKWYGRGDGGTPGDSSTKNRHVSTIASRQLTNSSDDSTIMLYWKEYNVISFIKMRNNSYSFKELRFCLQSGDPEAPQSQLTLVNGPANRHNPPNPHVWRNNNGCWQASSDANIFWMILCTAANMTRSFDTDNTWFIFWSKSVWLQKF